ncbi:FAS1-like dehydratase domain-containing protein [Lysinibacillus odysseyi]|uniref:Dehydratase n=1 Tax=Lysinibacillus odysseyi 34hs-1 = NBRC 100172 TaxID=1220589 RepID=A0A0A3IKM4_9BACI|nr:MaoC family dehydratase N-terminal domain-containing protein [Lysinibacillus odysseyi]KGR83378.1 dehydratase [Lysinibacillus odysseyi 34hs-1 = NBRC 100172]
MEVTKEHIGLSTERYKVDIEKGHIRRFCQAIGDTNPLFLDEQAATESAYGGLIAPLTFPVALSDEKVTFPLKLDVRRMLHGEQEFIYYKPLRSETSYTAQMKVADVYEREGKSGKMKFIILDTEFRDDNDELVVVSRTNIIYRTLQGAMK